MNADFDVETLGLDEQEIDSLLKSEPGLFPGLDASLEPKAKKEKMRS